LHFSIAGIIALRATVPEKVYNAWDEGSDDSEMGMDESDESDDIEEEVATKGKG
jgi:hypothetical protein